jgi:hypothetical protein
MESSGTARNDLIDNLREISEAIAERTNDSEYTNMVISLFSLGNIHAGFLMIAEQEAATLRDELDKKLRDTVVVIIRSYAITKIKALPEYDELSLEVKASKVSELIKQIRADVMCLVNKQCQP